MKFFAVDNEEIEIWGRVDTKNELQATRFNLKEHFLLRVII